MHTLRCIVLSSPLILHPLNWSVVTNRLIKQIPGQESSCDFLFKQRSLTNNFSQNTSVLCSSSGQIWDHLFDRSVRNIFVDRITSLSQREADMITHAIQLSETDHFVFWSDSKLFHPVEDTDLLDTEIRELIDSLLH